jgi:tRNA U34 5-carboxymethylaminomethyl modifying GTPase MnmE/TrmE
MIKTKNTKQTTVYDVEIAALRLELLTQTKLNEIAKNNKDAYDEIYEKNIGYTVEIGELNQHITKLAKEVDAALSYAVHKTQQKDKFKESSELLEIELEQALDRVESRAIIINETSTELNGIPNWVRWIFKYIF